jgi:hypothetical protein
MDIKENVINFVKYENLQSHSLWSFFLKRSDIGKGINRYVFLLYVLFFCCSIIIFLSNEIECIVLGAVIGIYFAFTLICGNYYNLRCFINKYNYGGITLIFASIMSLYSSYRFKTSLFNPLLLSLLVVSFIIQAIIWLLVVKRNIYLNVYKELPGFFKFNKVLLKNYYYIVALGVYILTLVAMNFIESDTTISIQAACLGSFVYFTLSIIFILLGNTLLYRNYLIKKYDLYDIIATTYNNNEGQQR